MLMRVLKQLSNGQAPGSIIYADTAEAAALVAADEAAYIDSVDTVPEIAYTIRRVYSDYGDNVSVSEKSKALLKFGRHDVLGTDYATVWMNTSEANETLVSSNLINRVSSSSTGDTQSIVIEGHTISGTDLTFLTQTVTLTGQTPVALPTALARATRLYNNGATDFAGNIWVYQSTSGVTGGVPDTKSLAHLNATGDKNQSEKCQTALSSQDYMFVTSAYGAVLSKTAAAVEFDFQVRLSGKVWRTVLDFGADNDSGVAEVSLKPYLIIPKNSDVRIRAKASTTNVEVEAGFQGYLAVIT